MTDRSFNLVDEPWISVADVGRVSLLQIFTEPGYRALGGNPVQKIALLKLLLAIAQAAATPADEAQWRALGADGLAAKCRDYLAKWHDRFYLYGEWPFLQMPAIAAAGVKSFGTVQPAIASGNTTLLTHGQSEQPLDDADKALLLVTLMGFALGGKKTDNSVVLSQGYQGKSKSGKAGPAVAHMGLLHSLLLGETLQHSLWLNLLTAEQVAADGRFAAGVGTAPWELMPADEDGTVARQLKASLMGRLVPLCRFCLLADDGLHYSEGIAHGNYSEGIWDPTVAVDPSGRKPRALWTNPDKRPWRELTALLGFIAQRQNHGFDCWQLTCTLDRARDVSQTVAIWSGGLRVSSNAGEQYATGNDDYVESEVWLPTSTLGSPWLAQLEAEMATLDTLAKQVYGCTLAYFKEQTVDGKNAAAQASQLFWQLCERDFQDLVDHCDNDGQSTAVRAQLRHRFAGYAQRAYDRHCPGDTARQLDAWAKCRPNTHKYLTKEAA